MVASRTSIMTVSPVTLLDASSFRLEARTSLFVSACLRPTYVFRKIMIWLRCTPLRSGGKGVNVVVATLLSLLSKISLEDVS